MHRSCFLYVLFVYSNTYFPAVFIADVVFVVLVMLCCAVLLLLSLSLLLLLLLLLLLYPCSYYQETVCVASICPFV